MVPCLEGLQVGRRGWERHEEAQRGLGCVRPLLRASLQNQEKKLTRLVRVTHHGLAW